MAEEEAVKTDDESVVESEVKCEAFTTLEYGTGKCLLSYEKVRVVGGRLSAWGAKCGLWIQGPASILPTIRRNV